MPTKEAFQTPIRFLPRLGHWMRRHRRIILVTQWSMVGLYAFLLFLPLVWPHADKSMHRLVLGIFWGMGWPLIFLSVMLLGRVWCGIFCPDGTLTEWMSRHGKKKSIPRWIRWSGWPCGMLVLISLYAQLIAAYDLYLGSLLLLGLPTLGALCCGYWYGNGRRIWCMYLCPANASFSLLEKLAPFYFRVDEKKCKQAQPPFPPVHCPTLINIRQMKGGSACHMCAQCSGYLDAVELASRSPGQEILDDSTQAVSTANTIALIFGLLGVCTLALLWKGNPWFSALKTLLANTPLAYLDQYTAPWWMLANHPGDAYVFSLLDGLSICLFVLGGGTLIFLFLWALLKLAVHISGSAHLSWQKLSLALIPVGGISLFLGLSSQTVMMLERDGFAATWIHVAQQMLLGFAAIFSSYLGAKLLIRQRSVRQYFALATFLLSVLLILWLGLQKLSA